MAHKKIIPYIICLLLPLISRAQHIRYHVESYTLKGSLSQDLGIIMNLDSAGVWQGEMKITEKAYGRTVFLGKFNNGVLVDTAFRYDMVGVKAEVIGCGGMPARSRFISIPYGKMNIRLPGTRNGITTVWNKPNDVPYLLTEERYVNHVQQGITRWFYPGGQRMGEFMYDGVRNGPAKEWYENGTPKSEGEYSNDEKTGRWKQYAPDGKLMEYHSCYGCETDSVFMYDDASGYLKWEMIFSNGKENGYVKSYHPNGKLASVCFYSNGYPYGESIGYDGYGQIQSCVLYVDGHLNGVAKTWHNNGQMLESTTYVYDDKTGPYTKWYRDGKIEETGNYYRNAKVGVWWQYDRSGKAKRYVFPLVPGLPNEPVVSNREEPAQKTFLHRDYGPGETVYPTLPTNGYMTEPLPVTKENGLSFIKRYREIKLVATITGEGIYRYRLLTRVTNKKHLALIKKLLVSSRWTHAQINRSQAESEVVLCLRWED